MRITILPFFYDNEQNLTKCIENFDTTGTLFCDGKRNKIKVFEVNNKTLNVKFFKIPIVFNRLIYRYFRRSKARRSFDYASLLLKMGIATPGPIAYVEYYSMLGLGKSYYISEHFNCDLSFVNLVVDKEYPDRENIIRQFTRFTFELHQKGIEFRDHSATNTLIKKISDKKYQFLLVDLNRMNFDVTMGFNDRMMNFCRLTSDTKIIAIMSSEYAQLYGVDKETLIFNKICYFVKKHHDKLENKKRFKQLIKF